ncbi:MAG TPA: hypothetical protein VFA07_06195 [Chthonomonadaceae bacterium]|nr:hypothetical protein [Chthonomonadaceae bacterium]
MNDRGFDPVEAIMILVGVVVVGGCVLIGVLYSIGQSLVHRGGIF